MKILLSLALPSGTELLIIIIVFGLLLVPYIFFILTLQNTLKAISHENRKMSPGQVWLLLIPVFHYVWNFIVVTRVSESIAAEYRAKDISTEAKPTYNTGLAYSILVCCGLIPVINIFTGIAAFICWILYWTQVSGSKNKLIHGRF